jgi:hypothetical protein
MLIWVGGWTGGRGAVVAVEPVGPLDGLYTFWLLVFGVEDMFILLTPDIAEP